MCRGEHGRDRVDLSTYEDVISPYEESEEDEDLGKRREKSRGLKVTLDALEEIDPNENTNANKEEAEEAEAPKEGREGDKTVKTPWGCLTCANTEKEVACRADSKLFPGLQGL